MGSTLASVHRGALFDIETVTDSDVRAQLLRLGFLDGEVECYHRIANGPVVLRRNGTTLAIGRRIAKDISVTLTDPT